MLAQFTRLPQFEAWAPRLGFRRLLPVLIDVKFFQLEFLEQPIKRRISHVVFHTLAYSGVAGAFECDSWHRNRGWLGIGYNEVIRRNGTVEAGRDPDAIPAGVYGLNRTGYHIAMEGNGDRKDFSGPQYAALADRVADVAHRARTPTGKKLSDVMRKNLFRCIGHREVNVLVKFLEWLNPRHRTTKTCPGAKVDCRQVRELVGEWLGSR